MTSLNQALTLIYESNNSLIYYQAVSEYGRPIIFKALNTNQPTVQQLIRFNNEYECTKALTVAGARKSIAQTRLDDKPALVLEYVPGQTLKQTFVDQKQSLVDILKVAINIAQILGELHQNRLIHKDINSQNILVNLESKQVNIIDFGLASRLDLRMQHLGNPEVLAGTLAYISPEQTGRMNRVVDYRTDLYSLGVTFYEMLTRRLPFEGHDALALVHAHLAQNPQPITALNPDAPAVLSDIVMKLLAKNAEERYQSAFGLKADLERCLAALANGKDVPSRADFDFALGQDDFSGQLHLPEKLYGRSQEIDTLLTAFERATASGQELILVTGAPGVGKSALVGEVHKPITEKRGCFVSGKFAQYQQHTPYAAFIQAFNQLADLLLTEPEVTLQQWRDKIVTAVGSNGAVLTEVVPHLENVIGPQPPVLKLDGVENRNRFNLTFQNFVQSLGTAEHPLVIFIDDWQWADMASLELLKVLLTNEANTKLLVIGAYRDNEVNPTHPFITTLNDLAAIGKTAQTIQLDNLQTKDVQQFIQDSLKCSPTDSQALTQLVYEKTQGNAFFTRQFLQNLYEEGWFHFDFDACRWMWDVAHIKAQNITDNVVKLMVSKLKRLPQQTAHFLQLAACIGSEFDLQTVAIISQTSPSEVRTNLEEALTQGLILPLDEYYQLLDTANLARFNFLHDRVRQAAYSQIPASKRQSAHLEIGRLLFANTLAAELTQRVFDIVQHYNQADSLISDKAERQQVIELNRQAANLAYEAAAYHSARSYLEKAIALMPVDAWDSYYDQMLNLNSQLATVLSLTGDFEEMERVVESVEAQARTISDTGQVTLAKLQGLLFRHDFPGAIDVGITFINAMGVSINPDPLPEEAFAYFQETADWLTEERIKALPQLPEASPEVGRILEVTVVLNGPTFGTNMNLCLVMVARYTRLIVEQGLAPWAPVNLSTFGVMLTAVLQDIPKARLLTDVTMQLFEERYPLDNLVPFINSSTGGFIVHHYEHLRQTLPILADGMKKGLATGAFLGAGYMAWWNTWHHLFAGNPLPQVETVCQQAVETCQQIQMERFKDWSALVYQAVLNLRGKNELPWILKGDAYDVEAMEALALQISDFAEVLRILFFKGWLHYLFDQSQAAVDFFRQAEGYLLFGSGLYLVPLYYFYDTLANSGRYGRSTADEQAQILARINHNLDQFEIWANSAPMNHQHKKELMEAEKARIEGRYWEAMELYQKAIQGARDNEFLSEEALANELCGRFWLSRGQEDLARFYLRKALNLYSLWGGEAKVNHLQAQYGVHFTHPLVQPQVVSDTFQMTTVKTSTLQQAASKSWLDMATLLKANQTLSQTVQLADLLAEMMRILLENAGAERAFILYQTENNWFIEAEGHVQKAEVQTRLHLPLSESAHLSLSVFNYVIHSGEAVVLANVAQTPQFAGESYLQKYQVKSVLCLPIFHQGQLKLVLYLENNLSEGVFTEERLELLQMLSGQMAISLENALMVADLQTAIAERKQAEARVHQLNEELEQRVIERTEQLEAANKELEAFSYSVSHDLRAPLRAIDGYTHILVEDYEQILDAEGQRVCGVIRDQTQRMGKLIDDLLTFSRLGRAQMQVSTIDMAALVGAVFHELTTPVERERIDFQVASMPSAVGDKNLLQQVWQNLLTNAIKFSSKCKRAVIEVGGVEEGSDIRYYVRDNGAGFDMRYVDKLFQVFQRLHSDREFEGTGVGLAIIQRVIHRHGGRVWAEGEVEQGATFYFTLPQRGDMG